MIHYTVCILGFVCKFPNAKQGR